MDWLFTQIKFKFICSAYILKVSELFDFKMLWESNLNEDPETVSLILIIFLIFLSFNFLYLYNIGSYLFYTYKNYACANGRACVSKLSSFRSLIRISIKRERFFIIQTHGLFKELLVCKYSLGISAAVTLLVIASLDVNKCEFWHRRAQSHELLEASINNTYANNMPR